MPYSYDRRQGASVYKKDDKLLVKIEGRTATVVVLDTVTREGKPWLYVQDVDTNKKALVPATDVVRSVARKPPEYLTHDPNDDEDSRPMSDGYQSVIQNVINHRHKGVVVGHEIQAYLRGFIVDSQNVHNLVREALKFARAEVVGGDQITPRDVERAIYKVVVQPVLGDDPLSKLLAKAIAHGDFIY